MTRKQSIPLRTLYDHTKTRFPEVSHSEEGFTESIIDELLTDPIRTRTERKQIQQQGLEFELQNHFPLNDFVCAARTYLLMAGIKEEQANRFYGELVEYDFFK